MDQEKRITRRSRDDTNPLESASADNDGSPGLLPAVRGWGGVAREAHDNCERGEDAIKKVRLRRNKSGE